MNTATLRSEDVLAKSSILSELRTFGYFRIKTMVLRGSDDLFIIADGKRRNILVQTKVHSLSDSERLLSLSEKKTLKKEALKDHREAWVATLLVDEKKNAINNIQWEMI